MQNPGILILEKLKKLRKARSITQFELDKMAGLPRGSITKIENGKREMTAPELIRVTKALKIRVTAFLGNEIYICNEEIETIQALRELHFEDYKMLITLLESRIYYASKEIEVEGEKKEYLESLVKTLYKLSLEDKRPKEQNVEKQRIRHKRKKPEEITI